MELPGDIKFFPNNEVECNALDYWNRIIRSIEVEVGVVLTANKRYMGILISPDIRLAQRNFNFSDVVEIDLTDILPTDIDIGQIGRISYCIIQLLPYDDFEYQDIRSNLDIAINRIREGSFYVTKNRDDTINQIIQLPYVIAKGSKRARWWGKGIFAPGLNIKSELKYSITGKAKLDVQIVLESVVSITGGHFIGRGLQMITNSEGDDTNEALMIPVKEIPDTGLSITSREVHIGKPDTRKHVENIDFIYDTYKNDAWKGETPALHPKDSKIRSPSSPKDFSLSSPKGFKMKDP